MIKRVNVMFENMSLGALLGVCIALFAAITTLDYISGNEVQLLIFYVAPICLISWYKDKTFGVILSFSGIGLWHIVQRISGQDYSYYLIPLWNGLLGFFFFVSMAYFVDVAKQNLKLQRFIADYDHLTGMLNRRGVLDKIKTLFPLLRRHKKHYSVAFIDVDNFKQVNDQMGHAVGDQVLIVCAETLTHTLRKSDLISRLGGDEFLVFLPETNLEQSNIIIGKLKEKLDMAAKSHDWPISFSIGVCTFDTTTDIEAAIAKTDLNMYEVKRRGKNAVSYTDCIAA